MATLSRTATTIAVTLVLCAASCVKYAQGAGGLRADRAAGATEPNDRDARCRRAVRRHKHFHVLTNSDNCKMTAVIMSCHRAQELWQREAYVLTALPAHHSPTPKAIEMAAAAALCDAMDAAWHCGRLGRPPPPPVLSPQLSRCSSASDSSVWSAHFR